MSLSYETQERITERLRVLYQILEDDIIIQTGGFFDYNIALFEDDPEQWEEEMLQRILGYEQDVARTVLTYNSTIEDVIQATTIDLMTESIADAEKWLDQGVEAAVFKTPSFDARDNFAIRQTMNAFNQRLMSTNLVMNSTLLAQASPTVTQVITSSVRLVNLGRLSPQQALGRQLAAFSHSGIPAFIDKAGKKWGLESYTDMMVRTTSNQTAGALQMERGKDYGADLYEVSSHMGARPRCAPFQGRIFSMSGTSSEYPAWSTTSYGEAAGLLGINCRHAIYPFWEGMSQQTYSPYPAEENEQRYKETQKQRYLERQIRKAKREAAVLEAAGLSDTGSRGSQPTSDKVRNRQRILRKYLRETGLPREILREQIPILPSN